MGAQQSTNTPNSNSSEVKRCYYEVLGVERQATDDEIKKAYRRKALELHPDRNYGDVENATSKFAEVQSAYEVLSDVQERAWYDSHRASILRGDGGGEEEHYEHSVRLTSASDIVSLMSKFNSSVPFTDSANGFYGSLQQTFETLAAEEDSACDWEGLEPVDYPNFGGSKDTYEDVAKPFYRVWMSFSTKKTFAWRDQYRTSDAPDRATRRLIEKENKRFRDEGIREFNDAVRSLVAFVRKRDPRFIPNSQSEADRQKILRDAVAAQAARSREANQAKLKNQIVPEWAQSGETQEDDEFSGSESEKSEIEHIECVVCNKTFKSEKQYEAHEKSKKHIKAVQQLQREMKKENKRLDLDTPSTGHEGRSPSPDKEDTDSYHNTNIIPDVVEIPENEISPHNEKPITVTSPDIPAQASVDEQSDASQDDEYAPRKEVEERFHALTENIDLNRDVSETDSSKQPKLGKAKGKRAKKAAKETQNPTQETEFQCKGCTAPFDSKNKLFDHLKENPKHAQLVPKAKGKKNKR
ncbi:Chaperone J-domain-containing protein [Glarea lozoyensis ATCC 20868]|uniref:Chaperone J-domain-containing protein n=2 Tax=Glarea lozoyensis TaxID=101852 RepID=S3DBR8_GLAL2|nr:Chaperone J-domain-containing protein [Glarea lozoyensis ATCC 20868]EHL00035.1 putative DnaJ like protein subfamily C member 21 [Glarea lozoyensis 74030]EPE34554.1 Chaperone J-domain-containing protein [Glarea lozoyensis ATCC 20868]